MIAGFLFGRGRDGMSISRNGILIVIALVCAAVFVLPASAAQPLHRLTCGGWGVSGDSEWETTDVVGDTVHFTCAAQQNAGDTWAGGGTFRGTLDGAPITVHFDIDGGIIFGAEPWRVASVWGDAEVSYMGGTSTERFAMSIAKDSRQRPNRIGAAVFILGTQGTGEPHTWWVDEGHGGYIRGGAINID
jgi:hypothetical protein